MSLDNGIKSALIEAKSSEGARQGKAPAQNFEPIKPPLSLNAPELSNSTADENVASTLKTPETADGFGFIPGERGGGLVSDSSIPLAETGTAITAADMPEQSAQ